MTTYIMYICIIKQRCGSEKGDSTTNGRSSKGGSPTTPGLHNKIPAYIVFVLYCIYIILYL